MKVRRCARRAGVWGIQGAVHADAPYDPAYDAPPRKTTSHPAPTPGRTLPRTHRAVFNPAPQPEATAPAVEEFLTPRPARPGCPPRKAALEIAPQHPELISVEQWRNLAIVQFRYRTHREVAAGIIHAATVMAPTLESNGLTVRSGAVEGVHPLSRSLLSHRYRSAATSTCPIRYRRTQRPIRTADRPPKNLT